MTEGLVPDVRLEGVSRTFGSHLAVDDLSLDAEQGEFLALLGPSGCGKTTCLRMIAGLEFPDRGRVLVAGQDVTSLPPSRRDVNTVFQSYALFEHLDVRGNVEFGLRRHGVARAERRRRVTEALALVQMDAFAVRRPRELSGGQQQRVALARALVMRPRVLLLDEPLAALDLKLRKEMQTELSRLHRELGCTFVFVTHDQGEAMAMADRIAVMRAGRIEQLDTPERVYDRPTTRFVADFIGEMNHFVVHAGLGSVQLAGSRLEAPVGAPTSGAFLLGIRPELVVVRPAGGPGTGVDGWPGVSARVTDMKVLGDRLRVSVVLPDGTRALAIRPRGEGAMLQGHAPGAEVTLTWSSADAVVLDDLDTEDARVREEAVG